MRLRGPDCYACVRRIEQAIPWGDRPPLLSTKCGAQSSPADDGAAKGDERVVDVVADLPADAQAAEPVREAAERRSARKDALKKTRSARELVL